MSSLPTASLMSIGELARRVGAAPSAIRYWERAGLLEPAERVGGQRRYRPDAVTRVGVIRLWQDAGFHIHEIKDLLATDPQGQGAWRTRGERKLTELRGQIARLQLAAEGLEHALACPHPALSACPTFTALVHRRAEGRPPEPHT